ncbi:MAG: xanthine dehydrogenase family protein subunit M [Acidobacteriia bacterium]|nr:xanthine dehydrogenase family protein subunit M [Terriglobia bacterium]
MFDLVEAFHRPSSIREALRLLHAGGRRARIVAGGTDVVVRADPEIRSLVDITRLGLTYIKRSGGAWAIGATTTMAQIEHSAALRALAGGILVEAAKGCGSVQLRNMATLGGNLANASPAADTAAPLLVLDAQVVVAGERSRRTLALADFFLKPGETALGKALLVEILIPAPPRGARTAWSFQKLGRTESDISVVNAAAGLQVDGKGVCKWCRIALGAVAPVPLRARAAEALVTGRKLDGSLVEQAAAEAAREASPITDIRATAEYRREMCRVLVKRALAECAARAGCSL